ncbi:MAG: hypothetical protein Q4C56_09015 [Peptococcaceae bacterium]|nr:hypothetical protein [Peptococcaceae bacterium]
MILTGKDYDKIHELTEIIWPYLVSVFDEDRNPNLEYNGFSLRKDAPQEAIDAFEEEVKFYNERTFG